MKNLFVYFSWSGNTDKLVKEVNNQFGYKVERVERKIPYSSDYNTCAYVEAKDEWENKTYPEIKNVDVDLAEYDNILLFFPIWWYTFPMSIASFVQTLKGYKGAVYVFANSYTNDPKYMVNSMKDLRNIDESIDFREGLFNKSAKEHIDFIKKLR